MQHLKIDNNLLNHWLVIITYALLKSRQLARKSSGNRLVTIAVAKCSNYSFGHAFSHRWLIHIAQFLLLRQDK